MSNETSEFDNLLAEFKENKFSTISIIKIIFSQKKIPEFTKQLIIKKDAVLLYMKKFIKDKYNDFLQSISILKECKTIVEVISELISHLQASLEEFLEEYGKQLQDKRHFSSQIKTINLEKSKLKIIHIFFSYIQKMDASIKDNRIESAIAILNTVTNRILPLSQSISLTKKMNLVGLNFKHKIITLIEDKVKSHMKKIDKEYASIGKIIYNKTQGRADREKNDFSSIYRKYDEGSLKGNFAANTEIDQKNINIKLSQGIKQSSALLRNSNIQFSLSKSSLIKNSVLKDRNFDDFNLIETISYLDFNQIEYNINLLKKVDNINNIKDYLYENRKSIIISTTNINNKYCTTKKQLYHQYFFEILGYLVIELSLYEIVSGIYNKHRFEGLILTLFEEMNNNISVSFLFLE